MDFFKRDDIQPLFREVGHYIDIPDHVFQYHCYSGVYLFECFPPYAGIHAAIKSECRGKTAVSDAKQAFQWAFDTFEVCKIFARIQKDRKDAQRFAIMCGMKRTSENDTHVFYEVSQCH